MPSTYSKDRTLPLRVSPQLRAQLDALGAMVPAALRLPRNTIAVVALTRGLESLAAEMRRDPMSVHRALAAMPPDDDAERDAAEREAVVKQAVEIMQTARAARAAKKGRKP